MDQSAISAPCISTELSPAIPPDKQGDMIMKTMTMYRPNTIQSALSDIDRCFESFFGDSAYSFGNVLAPAARIFNHLPAMDVRETGNAFSLEMELPGYDEKNIEIHVDGSSLTIASKQENAREEKGDHTAGDQDSDGTYILR